MAKTNGTNPYSGSPGEPRCSGRNRKHAHETGGARRPWKKAVPKGQCKDPPELLTYMNAQAQLPYKDQELLSSNSAAAYLCPVGAHLHKPAELQLEHHQATVGEAKGGKKPPKMKRRRCAICAKWNHKTEGCFVLTRRKNDNEMTTIVPMGTTVDHVTGGGRMKDDGQEGAV
jgi:hypothetical protein